MSRSTSVNIGHVDVSKRPESILLKEKPKARRRKDLIAEAVKLFPDTITPSEMYGKLAEALQGSEFNFDPGNDSRHRAEAAKAMKSAGFTAMNLGGTYTWSKRPALRRGKTTKRIG